MSESNPSPPKKRDRSPNHPMIGLKAAVERATAFHGKYGKHSVPIGTAQELWEYTPHGSAGNQCVAALAAYNLLDVAGTGKERKLTLSSEAIRIVRRAPDRSELLRAAAMAPAVHSEVVLHYEQDGGLPPDDILRNYLVWERPEGKRFNEDAVDGFISRLRDTLAYAEIDVEANGVENDEEIEEDTADNGNDGSEAPAKQVEVGSFVQWISQGVLQFETPRKVLGFDDDGAFAYVESTKTGIPMSELSVVEAPKSLRAPSAAPPVNPHYRDTNGEPKIGVRRETFQLAEGQIVIEWPEEISSESYEDAKDWTELFLRRLKRTISSDEDSL